MLYMAGMTCYNQIKVGTCKREVTSMGIEEQKEVAINRYVDLMRIKACEQGENRELEYQIKVARVKLQSFGIDYSELDL